MPSQRKITIAAILMSGLLLAGLAVLGICDYFQNHIARECGASCGLTGVPERFQT